MHLPDTTFLSCLSCLALLAVVAHSRSLESLELYTLGRQEHIRQVLIRDNPELNKPLSVRGYSQKPYDGAIPYSDYEHPKLLRRVFSRQEVKKEINDLGTLTKKMKKQTEEMKGYMRPGNEAKLHEMAQVNSQIRLVGNWDRVIAGAKDRVTDEIAALYAAGRTEAGEKLDQAYHTMLAAHVEMEEQHKKLVEASRELRSERSGPSTSGSSGRGSSSGDRGGRGSSAGRQRPTESGQRGHGRGS